MKSDDILEIGLVGDVMPGGPSVLPFSAARSREQIWEPVRNADVVLANLECPITSATTPRTPKRFNFKAPETCLELFDNRFVLGLANNHIMDYGAQGLADTIAALRKKGLRHAGAGSNIGEASQPVILTVKGIQVGFLCAADPRREPAGEDAPGTLPATPAILKPLLKSLRASVDVMVVSLHLGIEYSHYPTPAMQVLAELCFAEKADVVVFHHSHCLSGWNSRDEGAVLWGLGNYLFTSGGEEWNSLWTESAAWRVRVSTITRKLIDVTPVPIIIDASGIPVRAAPPACDRIARTISRLSRHTDVGRYLSLWRLLQFLSFRYIGIALGGYLRILRQHGPAGVLRSVNSTIKTHFAVERKGA